MPSWRLGEATVKAGGRRAGRRQLAFSLCATAAATGREESDAVVRDEFVALAVVGNDGKEGNRCHARVILLISMT